MLSSPLAHYLAWPRPADVEEDRQRLRQRALQLVASLGVQASSELRSERRPALRLLKNLLRLLWSPEKDLDAAIRRLPGREGYTLTKLSDWLEYARACGVPAVPYEMGPALTQGDIEATYEALDHRDFAALPAAVRTEVLPWIAAQQERGWMWRYEFCAPETIKEVLGCIRPAEYLRAQRIAVPFSVDARVLRCLWDCRFAEGEPTHLLARPWVVAKFESGFPVEIRVFRTPDGWAACNYYVQRPLPASYADLLEEAVRRTATFEQQALALSPLPGRPPFASAYTVDWLLSEGGELLMIEAGPPFTPQGGAHPCCFNPNFLRAGRRLLAAEPGSQFFCPPALQGLVDRVKAGEHPVQVCAGTDVAVLDVLAFAAVQGDLRAQAVAREFARTRGAAAVD